MPGLDLNRPRDLSAIVSVAFETWWHHLGVFVALAAIPIFPVVFLVGWWGGTLEDPDAVHVAASLTSTAVQALVVSPLVTAMHVLVVVGLSHGAHPSVGRALREGLRVLPFVSVAVLLYALACILGFVALLLPGVWVAVALYFAAQAAVVEDARGVAALRRSHQLVKRNWWRTFGILIVLGLMAALLALPLGFATQIVGDQADNGPLYVLGGAIAQTVSLSFTALAGTLLYFDLRARKMAAAAWTPQPDAELATPERPV
jgi:hypothetical protein